MYPLKQKADIFFYTFWTHLVGKFGEEIANSTKKHGCLGDILYKLVTLLISHHPTQAAERERCGQIHPLPQTRFARLSTFVASLSDLGVDACVWCGTRTFVVRP